jgi:hypothetical protein
MLAEALRFNKTLSKINLSFNRIDDDGALALLDALEVNTTLTELDHYYCNISFPLWKKFSDLLERNKRLKLMPYAEASLDLLVRHSPALKNMGFPTDVIPVLAEQLPNEVLAVFGQEWQEIFHITPDTKDVSIVKRPKKWVPLLDLPEFRDGSIVYDPCHEEIKVKREKFRLSSLF